jgi:hypothetical protein
LVDVQVRLEDSPLRIVPGLAEIDTVGAGGGPTVIVALAVAVPPAPVAVMV